MLQIQWWNFLNFNLLVFRRGGKTDKLQIQWWNFLNFNGQNGMVPNYLIADVWTLDKTY